jgi:hypothetical protein
MYGRGIVVRVVRVVDGPFDGWPAGVPDAGAVVPGPAVVAGGLAVVPGAAVVVDGLAVVVVPPVEAGPLVEAGPPVVGGPYGPTVVAGAAEPGGAVDVGAAGAVVVGATVVVPRDVVVGAAGPAMVLSSSVWRTTATVVPAAKITNVTRRSARARGRFTARPYPDAWARSAVDRVS